MAKYGRWTDARRRAIVAERAQSGLTVREYAEASGVPASTLQRWTRLYAERDDDAGPRLVAVEVQEDTPHAEPLYQPAAFEVVASGFTVRVPADFDADALTRLLRTVRAC